MLRDCGERIRGAPAILRLQRREILFRFYAHRPAHLLPLRVGTSEAPLIGRFFFVRIKGRAKKLPHLRWPTRELASVRGKLAVAARVSVA
jgi:hypothetical protein